MTSREVQSFVEEHSDAEITESGKVRCSVTGHEMPARLEALQQHFCGKRYKNAKARAKYDFKKHEPWIVEHKKNPHLLYCTLTKQPVTKQEKAVEGHVNGKKYKRLLAEALNPTEKKPSKKALAREAGKKRSRSESEGEDDEIEDLGSGDDCEDVEEDDGDAAEFFEEGAFWEREDDDEEDADEESGEELDDDDDDCEAAQPDDDLFWTRPKIAVGAKADTLDAAVSSKKKVSTTKAPMNDDLEPKELKPNKRELKKQRKADGGKASEGVGQVSARNGEPVASRSPNLASLPAKKAMLVPPMSLQGAASEKLLKTDKAVKVQKAKKQKAVS